MRIALISILFCTSCPASTDPETFAANWIRDLAEGRVDRAYEQLCLDAKEQLSSLGLRATNEAPKVFLTRLAGRYGGIDSMSVRETHRDYIDLEINTSRARLPLRLRRQKSGFCVALPDPS